MTIWPSCSDISVEKHGFWLKVEKALKVVTGRHMQAAKPTVDKVILVHISTFAFRVWLPIGRRVHSDQAGE